MRSLERLKPMMALDMIVACSLMGMSAVARGHSGVGGGLRLAGRRGDQHPGGNDSKGEPAAPEAAPLRIGAAVNSTLAFQEKVIAGGLRIATIPSLHQHTMAA
jgi:hypothetical protein